MRKRYEEMFDLTTVMMNDYDELTMRLMSWYLNLIENVFAFW